MEELETERQAKKAFLRKEVIEQGYQPDTFTEFIEREKGADVDLWTMEELKDCVDRFKRSFKQTDSEETDLGRGAEIEEVKTSLPSYIPQNKDSSILSNTSGSSLLPPPEMLTCSEISALLLIEPAYSLPVTPLPSTELSRVEKVTISLGK